MEVKNLDYLNNHNTTSSFAMILSVENFVNNLPYQYNAVVKSEYKEQWEHAMKEEMASH